MREVPKYYAHEAPLDAFAVKDRVRGLLVSVMIFINVPEKHFETGLPVLTQFGRLSMGVEASLVNFLIFIFHFGVFSYKVSLQWLRLIVSLIACNCVGYG